MSLSTGRPARTIHSGRVISRALSDGGHGPLNVLGGSPTINLDYSPIWRLLPAKWTDDAIAKGYCTKLTRATDVENAGARSIIESIAEGGSTPKAVGFLVNCLVDIGSTDHRADTLQLDPARRILPRGPITPSSTSHHASVQSGVFSAHDALLGVDWLVAAIPPISRAAKGDRVVKDIQECRQIFRSTVEYDQR